MTTRVAATDAHEGPVFVADENALYFTSVPHRNGGPPIVAIKRVDLESGRISIVRAEANVANGMTLDADGPPARLRAGDEVARGADQPLRLLDRALETVVDSFEGRPLNLAERHRRQIGQDDLVHRPELRLDPGLPPEPALTRRRLYRFDPVTGEIDRAQRVRPTRTARVLARRVVCSTSATGAWPHHVKAFDVVDGASS
jgi:sugar lactone lactonase YvrE